MRNFFRRCARVLWFLCWCWCLIGTPLDHIIMPAASTALLVSGFSPPSRQNRADHQYSYYYRSSYTSGRFATKARPRRSSDLYINQRTILPAKSTSNDDDSNSSRGGYRFGDVSKFLAKRAAKKVNELTGKETYKFGDLSLWLDGKAKARVQAIKKGGVDSSTGGTDSTYQYEFGDFTRWADALAKEKAAKFAGKESSEEYVLGDVSRTVIRKVRSGEYNVDDVYLALRILLTAGFALLPVAQLLPVKALVELVNLGLAKDVGLRLVELLAVVLDQRMKQALTGDANYQLGDLTKEKLRQSLARFTGKDVYEFGDIARAVAKRATEGGDSSTLGGSSGETNKDSSSSSEKEDRLLTLQDGVVEDLASWDQRFFETFIQRKTGTRVTALYEGAYRMGPTIHESSRG